MNSEYNSFKFALSFSSRERRNSSSLPFASFSEVFSSVVSTAASITSVFPSVEDFALLTIEGDEEGSSLDPSPFLCFCVRFLVKVLDKLLPVLPSFSSSPLPSPLRPALLECELSFVSSLCLETRSGDKSCKREESSSKAGASCSNRAAGVEEG